MHRKASRAIVAALLLLLARGTLKAAEIPADVLTVDSFENGMAAPDGWKQGNAVRGVKYVYDIETGSDGKRSLSLQKSELRYFPVAGWSRIFKRDGDKPFLKIEAKVKALKVTKAVIDVQFLDVNEKWIKHEWVDYIGQKNPGDPVATHDWKKYGGTMEIPQGTKQIAIEFQIYGPGKVWFDQLEARYVDPPKAATTNDGVDPGKSEKQLSRPADNDTVPSPLDVQLATGGLGRYILIPPADKATKSPPGYPLLLVLPGGDGSQDFFPFIQSLHERALDGRFVIAQLIAPPQAVWPTRASIARSSSIEEMIAAVIDDVAARHAIDRGQIYALAWSSGGPAAYAGILQDHSPLAGALIAMSVFKPDQLPPLAHAAGRRVYLLHSPEDSICPYRMAQLAEKQLTAAGAQVTLVNYVGGHGWHGEVYDEIRAGMQWLQHRPSR